ncbi:MAG: hypothetical protein VKL42_02050 [Snowella sp.]|nr:hypothetical protein [Snowella sp.]
MLIHHHRFVLPLLTFLCLGSSVSAQTAGQLTASLLGNDPIIPNTSPFTAEKPPVSQTIQSHLERIEIQSKGIAYLPISLDIKKTETIRGGDAFIEMANAAMLSPEELFLAKLEKLQAEVKSSPLETIQLKNALIHSDGFETAGQKQDFQIAKTISKLAQAKNATGNDPDLSSSIILSELRDDIPTREESGLSSFSSQDNLTVTGENTATQLPILDEKQIADSDQVLSQAISEPVTNGSDTSAPMNGQSETEEPKSLTELKQQLKVEPMIVEAGGQRTYPPALTFGIPSAFGPNWGDFFVGISGSTAGKARDSADGSISTGFGFGDSEKLIGLSLTYNMGSINNFGQTGTFDLSGSRIVYRGETSQVAIAAGWSAFAQYTTGNSGEEIIPSSVWGTVTSYSLLQPDDPVNKLPLLLSLGVGGGYYRQDPASTGVFGGIGLQVAPQLGVGLQWSGVGLNLGLSFVPVPTIPLTIVATGADLTDNSPGGTVFVLSVNYGFNFLPTSY